MFNICRRMTGDEEQAKDVLQDAFISVFSRLGSLKNDEMFSAWIKRIVINHCLNELRKKKAFVEALDENYDTAEYDTTVDQEFRTFERNRLLQAIDQLPEGCRTVLNLYVFEGYDHKEIGSILNITESASKAQYSKAKRRLRQILVPKPI